MAFIGLLWFLSVGIYSALRGQKPKITLESLSWSSLKVIGTEINVEEAQRTPLILSHIPFFGTFLTHKYGDFLIPGEKFGNWAFIIASALIWVDPSLTLFIIWIAGTTFWIVYQSVLVSSGDNVHLVGTKLAGSAQVHIVLRSMFVYLK